MLRRALRVRRAREVLRKVRKLVFVLGQPAYRMALRHRVAAAVELEHVPFEHAFRSVVDVGAGRGQFALVASRRFPNARLFCFEPLPAGREKLAAVVGRDYPVRIFDFAVGAEGKRVEFHVSESADSSSLRPITALQVAAFPGTAQKESMTVSVVPLTEVLTAEDLAAPSLLKIDAQGSELDVLRGAQGLLPTFTTILVECSFVEFYAHQALADEVICFLTGEGFRLRGVFSVAYDEQGRCLQADILFERQPS